MKNNDTGEFELVLGNRHLLSGFFVVALLFGVAFAMGYIVGRNSSPSAKLQAETAGGSAIAVPARPGAGGSLAPAEAPDPASTGAQTPETAEQAPAQPPEPAPTTQPARDGPAVASATPPAAKAAPINEAEVGETTAQEPPPGTYWQVTAIAQPQAEVFAKVLRDKGFHVSLSAGTKNLTRVLVGPYPDRETLGRAKSDLESAGFHPVILKKE